MPGNYLTYRIDYTNISIITGINVNLIDIIPNNTIYVPNSMSNAISPFSDVADDDEASFNGTQVIFCIDGGVAPGIGGTIGPFVSGRLYFTVQILTNPGIDAVTNEAVLSGGNFSNINTILVTTVSQIVLDAWDPGDDTAAGATELFPTLAYQSNGPHILNFSDTNDWYNIWMTN